MDITEVPLIESSSPLTVLEALNLMKDSHRSAIAIEDQLGSYRLVFAGRLLEAKSRGVQLARQVQGGYAVQARLALADGDDGSDEAGGFVSDDSPILGAELLDQTLRVITRHETFAAVINATGFYQCSGNPIHYFPDPYVQLGDECPMSAICAPQGGQSTIVDAV